MARQPKEDGLAQIVRGLLENNDINAASNRVIGRLEALDWPDSESPIPLPQELSTEQRSLAEAIAPLTPLHLGDYAIPISARVRKRWLGLDRGGPLEKEHSFQVAGKPVTWPLWRYLVTEDEDEEPKLEMLDRLEQTARMQVLAELVLESYGIDLDYDELLEDSLDAEEGQSAKWAAAFADELLILFENPPSIEANQYQHMVDELKFLVILPLARKGVPIKQRWESLVPVTKNKERMREIISALPPERQVDVVLARLGEAMALTAVTVALDVLEYLPPEAIVSQVQAWLKDKEWERNLGREKARALRRRLKSMLSKDS